ncbi:peptidoglycan-binding domain-containing protein [Sessilibacter corallicola]|uniref:peptidoglycan-binding domain-containing protein n=1 Tax=Sessilibacter corallicola TaxID=2904075 RepID=UPI001E391339|nr:peptidoglycan-binding domain-containing protein [Sessilibacter corallicola]MCE2027499.1 peptidoglycan-binding protein [Sessilibacter corallicola]
MSIELIKQSQDDLRVLTLIEKELDLAKELKVSGFVGIPEEKANFDKIELNDEIIVILRDRLYQLGYLSKKHPTGKDSGDLQDAITTLQAEAGLAIDGWVGLQTWQALQELFSFEHDSNLTKWNVFPYTSFMKRAICLRLKTLGFNLTVQSSDEAFNNVLQQWQRFLIILGVKPNNISCIDLVKWLFDIDALTELTNQNSRRLRENKTDQSLIQQCVGSLLKIELWLYGVEGIYPDGMPLKLERFKKVNKNKRSYRYHNDYKALREFWRDVGVRRVKHSKNILAMYLRGFPYLASDTSGTSNQLDVNTVIEELEVNSKLSGKAWKEMTFTGRIVDGLKRASRWFFGLVKKGANFIAKKVKVIVRIAKNLVNESVGFVRKTFKLLSDGLSMFFRNPVFDFKQQLVIVRDTDFDMKVFIDNKLSSKNTKKMTQFIETSNLRLKAAVKLSKILVGIVKFITVAVNAFSWFWLIKSVLKFRNKLTSDDIRLIKSAYLTFDY